MRANSLPVFIAKIFLYLPVCYWCWYALAEVSTFFVIYFIEPLLQGLFPKLIYAVEQSAYRIDVIVNVTAIGQNVPKGMVAEMPITVNPLIYSYGLPLAVALILASPFNLFKTLVNIFISILIFLFIQVWGVSFETLKVLFMQTPAELIDNVRLPSWQLSGIALAYQLGVLILPSVMPIIIWGVFYRDFMWQLISAVVRPEK